MRRKKRRVMKLKKRRGEDGQRQEGWYGETDWWKSRVQEILDCAVLPVTQAHHRRINDVEDLRR